MGSEELPGVCLCVLDKDPHKGYAMRLVPLVGLLENGSLPLAEWSPRRQEADHHHPPLEALEVQGPALEETKGSGW